MQSLRQYLLPVPLLQPVLLLRVTHRLYVTCARRVPLGLAETRRHKRLHGLPHMKKKLLPRQCHDGNAGLERAGSHDEVEESLHLVWQPYSLLSELSYIALYPYHPGGNNYK